MELAHIFKEELSSVLRLEPQLLQLPTRKTNVGVKFPKQKNAIEVIAREVTSGNAYILPLTLPNVKQNGKNRQPKSLKRHLPL